MYIIDLRRGINLAVDACLADLKVRYIYTHTHTHTHIYSSWRTRLLSPCHVSTPRYAQARGHAPPFTLSPTAPL